MGGFGSGRRWSPTSRRLVERCQALDVRDLGRRGLLRPGLKFSNSWTCGREDVTVDYRVDRKTVALHIMTVGPGGAQRSWELTTTLDWTACHYGGRRPWFVCPRCGVRVAILYAADQYACRRCHGLAYRSQREHLYGRALLKAQRIRCRLGGTANVIEPFPQRPRGMQWRTYLRLRTESELGTRQSLLAAAARFAL